MEEKKEENTLNKIAIYNNFLKIIKSCRHLLDFWK